ncbi:MAG: hypothetical protein QF578_02895 [Alphaproteobacteria bacterium]|jgi:hypothetical protein|nr:hypothetical protein [Alphaproteobacteria bacterium]MDP6814364.1 hypothetical protein [Alphaproteobacteria bacterium]
MSRHRYPTQTLVADYLRAGAGFFAPVALLVLTDLVAPVVYVLVFLAVLFGVYGGRTLLRQLTELEADDDGIRSRGPLGSALDREVDWAGLQDLRLRYFSTRRDGKDGWMQMVLRGDGGVLRIDSQLPEFDGIVRRAHAAATLRELALDPTTQTNLKASGLVPEAE